MPTEICAIEPRADDGTADADRQARAAWLRALQATAAIGKDPALTLPAVVNRAGTALSDRSALIGENGTLTYGELADRARR
jgi:hypothetical protein